MRCLSSSSVPKASASPGRPIDTFAGLGGDLLGLQLTHDLRIEVEISRHGRQRKTDFPQRLDRDARGLFGAGFVFLAAVEARPFALKPIGLVRPVGFGGLEMLFELGDEIVPDLLASASLITPSATSFSA